MRLEDLKGKQVRCRRPALREARSPHDHAAALLAFAVALYIDLASRGPLNGAEALGTFRTRAFLNPNSRLPDDRRLIPQVLRLRRSLAMSASDVERLQRAFLDNVPDMAWLKDRSSRYEAVNAAYLNASGVSAEEIIGRTPAEIWPADIAATYLETDRAVLAAASRGAMKRGAHARRRQGALVRHHQVTGPRSTWADRRHRGHFARHHRPQGRRGGAHRLARQDSGTLDFSRDGARE